MARPFSAVPASSSSSSFSATTRRADAGANGVRPLSESDSRS
jgi:hypothetical protein